MNIVEFFGLPQSGKSSVVKILVRLFDSKKDITNYREITIYHLFKKNKISYIEYIYWLYFEKKREKNLNRSLDLSKKKKFFEIKRLLKNLLPSRDKLLSKVDDLYIFHKNKHLEYIKFIKDLCNKYDAEDKFKYIFDWIKFEIIGYELKQEYPKKTLINSEGFYQICLSLIIRINLDETEIKDYINLCPKVDQLIILINKDFIKKDLEKYIRNKNKNFYFNRNFIKKYFYTIRLLKLFLNTTVYHFKYSELDGISNEIGMKIDK